MCLKKFLYVLITGINRDCITKRSAPRTDVYKRQPLRFVFNIVGIVFLWLFIDSFSYSISDTRLLQNSFFIYCSHGMIVTIIKKLAYSLLGFNSILMICAWMITFVLTLLLVWLLYKALKKYSPVFLNVICGER